MIKNQKLIKELVITEIYITKTEKFYSFFHVALFVADDPAKKEIKKILNNNNEKRSLFQDF